MVESTVIVLRAGVDDLEEHLRQKRLKWFGRFVRRDEKVENRRTKRNNGLTWSRRT